MTNYQIAGILYGISTFCATLALFILATLIHDHRQR